MNNSLAMLLGTVRCCMKDRNSDNGIVTCEERVTGQPSLRRKSSHYRKELEIVGHLSGGRGDANKAGFE
jgi:hypothetical protein